MDIETFDLGMGQPEGRLVQIRLGKTHPPASGTNCTNLSAQVWIGVSEVARALCDFWRTLGGQFLQHENREHPENHGRADLTALEHKP